MAIDVVTIDDFLNAEKIGLVYDRWNAGIEHHPNSIRLMKFLKKIDSNAYGDSFCWKTGGDGDNGETLMFQLDAFFELLEKLPESEKLIG
jgi:hypothetical protein